jgi:hypothetical protein
MSDIVERLRSSEPLPACPFDKISPLYLTMPDDKPCPFCGQENTLDGPDKCRGADTRIFGEAANEIEHLRKALDDERTRCTTICENWIGTFQDVDIKYTSPREYAVDAIEDIIDLIRDGHIPAAVGSLPTREGE